MPVIKKSKESLFTKLYKENYIKVYNLALSLTANEHDSEEITQEAFIKAFNSYDKFLGKSSFFTWIYRITINTAHDYLKSRKKSAIESLIQDGGYELNEVIDSNPGNNPETAFLENEIKYRCLHYITQCLPPDQRIPFCLCMYLKIPRKQAAEILEISTDCLKTRLHRARKKWNDYMDGRCSLIRKENPCRCIQWIKFALKSGWIDKETHDRTRNEISIHLKKDAYSISDIKAVYTQISDSNIPEKIIRRMKESLKLKEWGIFS